jgi:hypothetical protein
MTTKMRSKPSLIPAYPYRDLDGTPWPGCDHHQMTEDPVELAILRGVADAILAAGLPEPFVHAGDRILTTWGCERNKKLRIREAIISYVKLGLYRDRMSMFYRPAYEYLAKDERTEGMVLGDIEREDGEKWVATRGGNWAPFWFRLEWISPLHGGIERAADGECR